MPRMILELFGETISILTSILEQTPGILGSRDVGLAIEC